MSLILSEVGNIPEGMGELQGDDLINEDDHDNDALDGEDRCDGSGALGNRKLLRVKIPT